MEKGAARIEAGFQESASHPTTNEAYVRRILRQLSICSITSQMGCVLRSYTIQPLANKSERKFAQRLDTKIRLKKRAVYTVSSQSRRRLQINSPHATK